MDRRYAPVLIQFHHIGIGILSGRGYALQAHGSGSPPPGLLHGVVIDVAKDVAVDKKELLVQLILEALDSARSAQQLRFKMIVDVNP